MVIISWAVLSQSNKTIEIHRLAIISALTALIPFLQFGFGLLSFSGQAWINAAFLTGLTVVLIVGARWESIKSSQAMDGLFLAIGLASIISVGLQLYQWLGLFFEPLDLWINGVPHSRPFANFIQPNQLATFLLWGLLGCAWGVERGQIGRRVAIVLSLYLLFGVALTQSRTALIAIIGMAIASVLWRRFWAVKGLHAVIAGLAVFYAVCLVSIPWVSSLLSLEKGVNVFARSGNEIRLLAYRQFIDAALHEPLWGYGWSQTAAAQLAVAENHPSLNGVFMQSHNLFLDLILWNGIPIGGAISILLIWWFARKIKRIASAQNAILIMFVGVVGWHAMLELPLHYAYMLLPTGLVMGVVNSRLHEPVLLHLYRWQFASVLLLSTALLVVITRDYFRIEEDFFVLRFEHSKIGKRPQGPPPTVLVLNQMREFIRFGRTKIVKNNPITELNWMTKVAYSYPATGNLYNLALALSWSNLNDEAELLVTKLRNISSPEEFDRMRKNWRNAAASDIQLAKVIWPS